MPSFPGSLFSSGTYTTRAVPSSSLTYVRIAYQSERWRGEVVSQRRVGGKEREGDHACMRKRPTMGVELKKRGAKLAGILQRVHRKDRSARLAIIQRRYSRRDGSNIVPSANGKNASSATEIWHCKVVFLALRRTHKMPSPFRDISWPCVLVAAHRDVSTKHLC